MIYLTIIVVTVIVCLTIIMLELIKGNRRIKELEDAKQALEDTRGTHLRHTDIEDIDCARAKLNEAVLLINGFHENAELQLLQADQLIDRFSGAISGFDKLRARDYKTGKRPQV
jgi:hypothetical protein